MSTISKHGAVSNYEMTGNRAIDLVAYSVSWHINNNVSVKEIKLNNHYYQWFKQGIKLLAENKGQVFDPDAIMMFKGVPIVDGGRSQWAPMIITSNQGQPRTISMN